MEKSNWPFKNLTVSLSLPLNEMLGTLLANLPDVQVEQDTLINQNSLLLLKLTSGLTKCEAYQTARSRERQFLPEERNYVNCTEHTEPL